MNAYQEFLAAGHSDSEWDDYAAKRNAEFRAKQQAIKDAEIVAHNIRFEKLELFLAQYSPMQAGRLRKSMTASLMLNGQLAKRYEHAERLASLGYTKRDDRLYSLAGSFLTATDVTQVFINYVDYLNNQ